MILSVAALRIKIIIVSVDMPHLLSKWLENKATNLVSRILNKTNKKSKITRAAHAIYKKGSAQT